VENIDNFIEISDKDISDKLVNEHLHLIDGFTKFPTFICHFLENNKLDSIVVAVQNIPSSDFNDMINQIRKMRLSNHIILYQAKPFFIRLGLVPLSYDIVNYQSRIRRRNEKLNQLLNE
jgi:hypothetical protein